MQRSGIQGAGIAWYTPRSWRELEAVTDEPLCSYDEFVRKSAEHIRRFEAEGIRAERILIDVAHMAAWCKRQGLRVDSKGRSMYGAALLAAGGDTAELDALGFEDRSKRAAH
jgi:hypothetical protein